MHSGRFHITTASARQAAARVAELPFPPAGLRAVSNLEAVHAWLVEVAEFATRDRAVEIERYDDSQVWRLEARHGGLALIVRESSTGDRPSVVAVVLRGDEVPPPTANAAKTLAAAAALEAKIARPGFRRLTIYTDLWTLCQTAPHMAYQLAERLHLAARMSRDDADASRDVSDAHLDAYQGLMAAHERAKARSSVKDTEQQRGRGGRRGEGLYAGGHLVEAQVEMARAAAALVAPLLARG